MKSNCCKAPMKVKGNTTKYYVCDKCGEACDNYYKETRKALNKALDEYGETLKMLGGEQKELVDGGEWNKEFNNIFPNERHKEEFKKGYNQRLKDEGKDGERWQHLYL